MGTRLAVSILAFTAFLGACDATITAPYAERLTSLAVSAGTSCGLTDDGVALCWGVGEWGQLGDGTGIPHDAPAPVASGARFTQLVAGRAHTCGLRADGRVFCWGDNRQAQLGEFDGELDCVLRMSNGWDQDFGDDCSAVPSPLKTAVRFKALSAAADQTCGLSTSGEIWCWGSSNYGLGDSAHTTSATPVKVTASEHFKGIAVGPYHSCAVDTDGLGWCWGFGFNGSTGLGTADSLTPSRATPARIASEVMLRAIAVGTSHSCGLATTGAILCWGEGTHGERGDSTTTTARHTPLYVLSDRYFSAIAAGPARSCALERGTGAAWCWGENTTGTLGVGGTNFDRTAPAAVLGGVHYESIAISRYDIASPICGRGGDGLYCWGQVPQPLTFEE